MSTLLARDSFRNYAFTRDKMVCIVPGCGRKMSSFDDKRFDAHHIIERRLWADPDEMGGYFLENAATVCDDTHHRQAEINAIPPQAFWRWLNVPFNVAPVPRSFNGNRDTDKWGNPFKVPVHDRVFIKYPSTPYLPFSPGHREGDDDQMSIEVFEQLSHIPLVVTVKMDGSNICMTSKYVASRAAHEHSASHSSFDMLRASYQTEYRWKIPDYMQVFGEWLYAKHSIHYTGNLKLSSLLNIFAVYDTRYHLFLGFDEVLKIATGMELMVPPIVAELEPVNDVWKLRGMFERMAESVIKKGHEGIVIRNKYPFHYGQFQTWMAKFVRSNHVQTDVHWSTQKVVRNEVVK